MALQKQSINIPFAQGLNTKVDPNQIPIGQFLTFQNVIFNTPGQLGKRNGFGSLSSLPDASYNYTTTLNGNLVAIGGSLEALSQGSQTWSNRGYISQAQLSTVSLIRTSTNQSQVDTAISNNGLSCVVYTDNIVSGSTTSPVYKYAVVDSTTGQNILSPQKIASTTGTISFFPRVFNLGNNFVLVFPVYDGASFHLQYQTISSINPAPLGNSANDLATNFSPATVGSSTGFDGVVAGGTLFLSWNSSSNAGVKSTFLTQYFQQGNVVTIASQSASIVSVTADTTGNTPVIWTSAYVIGSNSGVVVATNQNLSTLFSAQQFVSSATSQIQNIASYAQNGTLNILYESINGYSYDLSVLSNLILTRSVSNTGSLGTPNILVRSVGLASKAFFVGSQSYFLAGYQSGYQSTYFMLNSAGGVVSKLAYGNGVGYVTTGLPSVSVFNNTAYFGYLIKDLIASVNKGTAVSSTTQVAGIYSQTGINLCSMSFSTGKTFSIETARNLHINGGFLWQYDGFQPVEHNFHLYPDNVEVTTIGSGGSVAAGTYYYQATYEWMDNQGLIYRSAPSIPTAIVLGSSTSTNTINIPTLRLTQKTTNPVKIVLYRWSTNQQTYFQVTSITQPVLNSLTSDYVTITDRASDATILGNSILYTTGGVVEDIGAPPCSAMTIYDTRLWLVDSEDQNLLWFSKQIVDGEPVEMSDLFTFYVSPSLGVGSTGPITALAAMDDKLIIFKKNAIYYISGSGPDITGANSGYSQPIFVTSTVGCSNQNSIVLTPNGLMFQSDKGIWILGRDLSTNYIGSMVEAFNSYQVQSAVVPPNTREVRFHLSNGTVLVYDYMFNQWGTFLISSPQGRSACVYQNLHTFVSSDGSVYQETPGIYLDGSSPVLMSFTTGWINPSNLQGYNRLYRAYLLGSWLSPHKYTLGISYDYNPSIVQSVLVSPANYSPSYGGDTNWGSGAYWGGVSPVEQWQINFQRQQCQSFQLTFQEYFDSTIGPQAGAGLTLSGMNLVVGVKKSYPRNIPPTNMTG